MPLSKIPVGELVHNVELRPFGGGQLARAAGCFLRLLEKGCGPKGAYAAVEMKSKEKRLLRMNCLATIGRLGNVNHNRIVLGKAGRSRWLGRRPKVRGVAMNRCDHPHGGGRGKCKGKNPVSKWNVPAKGYRTRKKKHRTNQFRLSRRPMNKRRYKKKSEGASWNKIERSVVNKQNNNKDKK